MIVGKMLVHKNNKLMADNFDARLIETHLVRKKVLLILLKSNLHEKLKNMNKKVIPNKARHRG